MAGTRSYDLACSTLDQSKILRRWTAEQLTMESDIAHDETRRGTYQHTSAGSLWLRETFIDETRSSYRTCSCSAYNAICYMTLGAVI
jgi:hypothetical protein